MSRDLLCGGAAVVVLLLAGCEPIRSSAEASNASDPADQPVVERYMDPLGRFSVIIPDGWEAITYKDSNASGLVLTIGPTIAGPLIEVVDTWVHAEPAGDWTTETLFENRRLRLENFARNSGGTMIYREISSGRMDTVAGEAYYHVYDSGLPGSKGRYLDAYLVSEATAWNIGGGSVPDLWDKHRREIEHLVRSFRLEPGAPLAQQAPLIQHFFPFLLQDAPARTASRH